MFDSHLQIGPAFLWAEVVYGSDYFPTFTLQSGQGAGAYDPKLQYIPRPTTGVYLGRTEGGTSFDINEGEEEIKANGSVTVTDSFINSLTLQVKTKLAFNGDTAITKYSSIGGVDLGYRRFIGRRTEKPRYTLLVAITDFYNPDESKRDIIHYILLFRGRFSTTSIQYGPGHNYVDLQYNVESANTGACLFPEGMDFGHEFYLNRYDPTILVDPDNPTVSVTSNPRTPTAIGASIFMQL